jgi:chlorite dismutase
MTDKSTTLVPEEGWHCLHLFYRIEHGQWQLLSREEQNAAKTNLTRLVQEILAIDSTQLLTLSVVTPKADLGFMLITPDLHNANKIDKQLSLSLGQDVLTPVYSYLSLTEESEYITTEEEYRETLEKEHNLELRRKKEELIEEVADTFSNILLGEKIPLDVVNVGTGEIIVPANRKFTKTLLRKMANAYADIEIDPSPIRNKIREIIFHCKPRFAELELELAAESPEFAEELSAFRDRMKHYRQERVYPTLPDWPVVCFYNMSKRRGEERNWYALPYQERRKLMKGHASVGREFSGKVKQLITGSTGLDDAEWGVTLFARDTFQIKAIVYKMRFDPVSAEYADFGEFYIGIQLPLDELFRRLQL